MPNYATKRDLKYADELIHLLLLKKTDLANLEYDVGEVDIDKLKNIPSNLTNLKIIVNKLDTDKLVPAPVGLSK